MKDKLLQASKEVLEQTKVDELATIEIVSKDSVIDGKEVTIRLKYLPNFKDDTKPKISSKVDGANL